MRGGATVGVNFSGGDKYISAFLFLIFKLRILDKKCLWFIPPPLDITIWKEEGGGMPHTEITHSHSMTSDMLHTLTHPGKKI